MWKGVARQAELVDDMPRVTMNGPIRLGLPFSMTMRCEPLSGRRRPAFSVGVISGTYDVEGAGEYSRYSGRVLETDASINRGSDGGPVLDRDGRLIGVISLSFSHSRFMGTAIPVDVIRNRLK